MQAAQAAYDHLDEVKHQGVSVSELMALRSRLRESIGDEAG